eukprot:m.28480 g.28480  ORF g.28480 m.28480 type:complete len:90 (-) comp10449_c0_seq1:206-475(-)
MTGPSLICSVSAPALWLPTLSAKFTTVQLVATLLLTNWPCHKPQFYSSSPPLQGPLCTFPLLLPFMRKAANNVVHKCTSQNDEFEMFFF